jgi:hypothetical protein
MSKQESEEQLSAKQKRDELFDNSLEASLSVQDSLIDAHLSANITPHEVKNIMMLELPHIISNTIKKGGNKVTTRSIEEIEGHYKSLSDQV